MYKLKKGSNRMIIRVAIDTDEMFFNINEDQWELIRALQDAGCLAKMLKSIRSIVSVSIKINTV